MQRTSYSAAEDAARTARRGPWADPHAMPPWDWRNGDGPGTQKGASRLARTARASVTATRLHMYRQARGNLLCYPRRHTTLPAIAKAAQVGIFTPDAGSERRALMPLSAACQNE